MADAAYYRAWRAAHPAYRKRQAQLRAERRRRHGREDRTTEYAKRQPRAEVVASLPELHTGHPLFDQARAIVGRRTSTLTVWLDPLHDDLVSVATLAILQGRDAVEAVRAFRAREHTWRRMTCPIIVDPIGVAA